MFVTNYLVWLYVVLVSVSQVTLASRVNTTVSEGKVVISGNHNEVVVSAARTQDSKTAVAEIKSKLESLKKSNTVLFTKVEGISRRLSVLQKRDNYALLFPHKGITDYAIVRRMPILKAVTFCLWIKTTDKGNQGALLSYNAVPGKDNELLLMDYRKFQFWVGLKERATSVSANDGKWHHICATWENTAGSWRLYKDGKVEAAGKGLRKGFMIRGGGALVLGQEQEKVGGSFDANQSFLGEMMGVNIWDYVINEQEITRMSRSCLTGVGNVFQWRDFKPHVKGSVRIIKASCF